MSFESEILFLGGVDVKGRTVVESLIYFKVVFFYLVNLRVWGENGALFVQV